MSNSRLPQGPIRPSDPDAVRFLRAAPQTLLRARRALKAWGLSWAQYNVLAQLVEREAPPGVREAMEEMGDGVPHRLDELEEMGYVTREPDPEDGRKKIVTVTPEGERAKGQATLALEQVEVPRRVKDLDPAPNAP